MSKQVGVIFSVTTVVQADSHTVNKNTASRPELIQGQSVLPQKAVK